MFLLATLYRRSHILELTEINNYGNVEACLNQQTRSPFSVLARNATGIDNLEEQYQTSNVKESDGEGMFLKKDDPKVTALMQQAELLSSLAQKVNAENTEQSMENAWKVKPRNHNFSTNMKIAKCSELLLYMFRSFRIF